MATQKLSYNSRLVVPLSTTRLCLGCEMDDEEEELDGGTIEEEIDGGALAMQVLLFAVVGCWWRCACSAPP